MKASKISMNARFARNKDLIRGQLSNSKSILHHCFVEFPTVIKVNTIVERIRMNQDVRVAHLFKYEYPLIDIGARSVVKREAGSIATTLRDVSR